MPETTIDDLLDRFEANSHTDEDGIEFWYARDMRDLLEYAKWDKFELGPILAAMEACENSRIPKESQFVEVFPRLGKNPQGGFKITDKGLRFIVEEFKDRP